MANANSSARIVSVEASRNTFQHLVSNTQILGDRIVCLNYAVTDTAAPTTTLHFCPSDLGLSTLNKENWFDDPKSRFHGRSTIEETVPTITLDRLISEHGIPDLIKIDVEGAELDVIRSLSRKVACLCFEWASEARRAACDCIDVLRTLGFSRFFVQQGDSYTFRPAESDYADASTVKAQLADTVDRIHWGMVWAV